MAENIRTFLTKEGLGHYNDKIQAWVEGRDDLFDAAGSASTVQDKLDEEIARAKAAEEANTGAAAAAKTAADNAQAAADAAQGEVNTLETYVGTIPSTAGVTNVVAYIEKKTEGIATDAALSQLQQDLDAAEADIATIKGDYLKGTDKTELAGDIADNAAAIAKLDGAVTEEGSIKNQIKDAVDTEKSARETAVAGVQNEVNTLGQTHATDKAALEASIAAAKKVGEDTADALENYKTSNNAAVKAIQDDYLTSEDDTALRGLITAEAERADAAEKANASAIAKIKDGTTMDSFADVEAAISQLESGESGLGDRVKAIEDDYLKAADKTELINAVNAEKQRAEGIEAGHETRISTMEAFFEGADKSAEAVDKLIELQEYIASDESGAATMAGNIQKNTQNIAAEKQRAEGVEAGLNSRLAAVEVKFGEGEGTVEDMVADVQAEVDALEQAHATDKQALEAADTAIKGRLDALEAIDHEHGNKALLDTYTQTEANLADAVAKKHDHANKSVLDGIDAAKVSNWDAAYDNSHTHGNKTVLDGITAEKVAAWDSAKNDAIAAFTEITTAEIDELFA